MGMAAFQNTVHAIFLPSAKILSVLFHRVGGATTPFRRHTWPMSRRILWAPGDVYTIGTIVDGCSFCLQ